MVGIKAEDFPYRFEQTQIPVECTKGAFAMKGVYDRKGGKWIKVES